MNYTLKEVKLYLKQLSTEIRIKKQLRKTVYGNIEHFKKEDVEKVKSRNWYLDTYKREFRHHHIAYCLFRGKTRTEIENKTENPPNESKIKSILTSIQIDMEELRNEREKDVCLSA